MSISGVGLRSNLLVKLGVAAAVSSSFAFWLASPRPMFTVTFKIFGTAMMFEYPNFFVSAGTASFRYLSCSRVIIA